MICAIPVIANSPKGFVWHRLSENHLVNREINCLCYDYGYNFFVLNKIIADPAKLLFYSGKFYKYCAG